MRDSYNTVAIIPARLASTRLPRKVLREIAGKLMVQRVYEAAKRCPLLDEVIIATDSEEVMEVARAKGWKAEMTAADHRSGTDRVHELMQKVRAEVYVNIQGDEPLARPEHLAALLRPMARPEVQVATIKTPCPAEDVANLSAVKVVTDKNGRALYFSRCTIPFDREGASPVQYYKHLGFYAYRPAALEKFRQWPESSLEAAERLEQLRFLENGVDIYVEETPFNTVGVDTEDDLRRVEEMIRAGV